MKTTSCIGLVGGLLLVNSIALAGNQTITPKLGEYRLDSSSQTIVNRNSTFTEDSSRYQGLEYQYEVIEHLTIGGSLDSFEHDYVRSGIKGKVDSNLAMLNLKYHFAVTDGVKPYMGIMAGIAKIDLSGSVQGTARGFASGFGMGVAIPINDMLGLGVEYRKIHADVTADVAGGGTTNVDISGELLSANLHITF